MECVWLRIRPPDPRSSRWCAVLFGLQTRRALLAGSILMLVLMFGSSLREDWPTVGIQLTYSVVYCILIAGVQFDGFGIDRVKRSSL